MLIFCYTLTMKIILGTDHAGFELKEKVEQYLIDKNYEVVDKGAFSENPEDDFNDFVVPVALEVSQNPATLKGIILGGSGQGEAMAANRFKNVRAVVYYGGSEQIIRWSREHNNANILSLGARLLTEQEALNAIDLWLHTDFLAEEKYQRRNNKLDEM